MKIISNSKFYIEGSKIDIVIQSRFPQWVLLFDGKDIRFHYTENELLSTAKKNQNFLMIIYFSWFKIIKLNVSSFNRNVISINSKASFYKLQKFINFPKTVQFTSFNKLLKIHLKKQNLSPPPNVSGRVQFKKLTFNINK